MPPGDDSSKLVLLRERHCQASGCNAVFYICKRCDRGQGYCSPPCRARTRRLQHRAASRRYQNTPEGRAGHRDYQRVYRERVRAALAVFAAALAVLFTLRSLPLVIQPITAPPTEPVPPRVTDQSSNSADSGSSCGSDRPRSTPHASAQRHPCTPTPHCWPIPSRGLRCLVCRRPGYLQKGDPHEPAYPGK